MTTLIVGHDNEPLRRRVCEWLRANGIDPNQVPAESRISVTDDAVTLDVYRLTADGKRQGDPGNPNTPWTERRTVPLRVPWRHAVIGAA